MSCAAADWVNSRCRRIRPILTTSPALIRRSSASAKPRSANTLPELGSCSRAFLFSILHLTPQLFKTLPDQIHLGLRCRDPGLGLLLEGMDHVNRVPDGDRIDSAVGSARIMGRNFHHTAAETMQRLGLGAHFAQLRGVQCIANVVLDAGWKRLHVGTGIGEPREFLHALFHAYIGISRNGVSN